MQYIFLLLTYQNQIINSIALSLSYSLVPLQQKERELFSHKLEPHSSEPKEKQMNALLFWWLKFKNHEYHEEQRRRGGLPSYLRAADAAYIAVIIPAQALK